MKSLGKPPYKAIDVFSECIKLRRNRELKSRLESVKEQIDAAEENYALLGNASSLHLVQSSSGVGTCVTTGEMERLYTEVFARKSSQMRSVYDAIKLAPKHDICPICAQRNVSTLDHYLPKARNPALAVTPLNLIPACSECNRTKGNHHPPTAETQFIHPYFDSVDNEIWLFAEVAQTTPPAVVFSARAPSSWGETIRARLSFHFQMFGLAELYSAQAGMTLAGIADTLKSVSERGGDTEVRFFLQDAADSWKKASKNSWQAALYAALAQSAWFCTTGFKLIASRY